MKPSLIPIACGTALALMAGAAAAHWCSVRDMVKLASVMPAYTPAPGRTPAPTRHLPDDAPSREAKEFLALARESSNKGPAREAVAERLHPASHNTSPSVTAANGSTDARIEKMLQLMEGTLEENRRLRETQAETNRDLMELQFRVDMYDGEFRPLKVEEEATPFDDGSGGMGVLPPLE